MDRHTNRYAYHNALHLSQGSNNAKGLRMKNLTNISKFWNLMEIFFIFLQIIINDVLLLIQQLLPTCHLF